MTGTQIQESCEAKQMATHVLGGNIVRNHVYVIQTAALKRPALAVGIQRNSFDRQERYENL